jgi:hypothetical protein
LYKDETEKTHYTKLHYHTTTVRTRLEKLTVPSSAATDVDKDGVGTFQNFLVPILSIQGDDIGRKWIDSICPKRKQTDRRQEKHSNDESHYSMLVVVVVLVVVERGGLSLVLGGC